MLLLERDLARDPFFSDLAELDLALGFDFALGGVRDRDCERERLDDDSRRRFFDRLRWLLLRFTCEWCLVDRCLLLRERR